MRRLTNNKEGGRNLRFVRTEFRFVNEFRVHFQTLKRQVTAGNSRHEIKKLQNAISQPALFSARANHWSIVVFNCQFFYKNYGTARLSTGVRFLNYSKSNFALVLPSHRVLCIFILIWKVLPKQFPY